MLLLYIPNNGYFDNKYKIFLSVDFFFPKTYGICSEKNFTFTERYFLQVFLLLPYGRDHGELK